MAKQSEPYDFVTIGAERTRLRDAYHAFLQMRWGFALGLIVVSYLALNGVFALVYLGVGGIHDAQPGSFLDAYYFSVQTLGTIGYGDLYPMSRAANLVVIVESVTGLLVTAVATGLVFAKFSRTTSRMVFSSRAVITLLDGVPTLMIRLGNARGNRIIDSHIRLTYARTEITREGATMYRLYDLKAVREWMPALARSWTVLHQINEGSPLFGRTPAELKREEAEISVTLVGTDDTTLQQVHALYRYMDDEVVWGARHADILSEPSPTRILVDLRRFHDLEPTEPSADFPYPPRG